MTTEPDAHPTCPQPTLEMDDSETMSYPNSEAAPSADRAPSTARRRRTVIDMPPEYEGREQSYLKHRVLSEYLVEWGIKIGSISRAGKPVTLWYVDCFAGPWTSQAQNLEDTSIHIGLHALESAADVWREAGHRVETRAIFVEQSRKAHKKLQEFLAKRGGRVKTEALHGEFGSQVATIQARIGNDPAFIFVDPTGFKGAAMHHITKLTKPRMRDVLVNVMYNDINRFKNDSREFLRDHFRNFFGTHLPPDLDEDAMMDLYRANLKEECGLSFSADVAIPHKTSERTWFHLVLGVNRPEGLDLIRRIEKKVCGREAGSVRTSAKMRRDEARTSQLGLPMDLAPEQDRSYADRNKLDQPKALEALVAEVRRTGGGRFDALWPTVLEAHHITRTQLGQLAFQEVKRGRLLVSPARLGARSVTDEDRLVLGSADTQP